MVYYTGVILIYDISAIFYVASYTSVILPCGLLYRYDPAVWLIIQVSCLYVGYYTGVTLLGRFLSKCDTAMLLIIQV